VVERKHCWRENRHLTLSVASATMLKDAGRRQPAAACPAFLPAALPTEPADASDDGAAFLLPSLAPTRDSNLFSHPATAAATTPPSTCPLSRMPIMERDVCVNSDRTTPVRVRGRGRGRRAADVRGDKSPSLTYFDSAPSRYLRVCWSSLARDALPGGGSGKP